MVSFSRSTNSSISYNFNFNAIKLEPLKNNDSIFNSKYLKILKDFNINFLPASISINTDYIRQFNKQKFREVDLTQDNIGIQELFLFIKQSSNFFINNNYIFISLICVVGTVCK